LIRKGCARIVREPVDVFEDVSRPGRIDRDHFFSPNALQRFSHIVQEIRTTTRLQRAA
jgi:hypothetical protein